MTVQKHQRVTALKIRRNVSKVTSGERETLVRTCCIVSARGTALPPVSCIFPRKNFKNYMTKNTPAATLGLAAPSEWTNSEIVPEVIQHFIEHTNSTPENPSILIMDNHESHLSIKTLNLAKAAGNILTLPPAPTHWSKVAAVGHGYIWTFQDILQCSHRYLAITKPRQTRFYL